MQEDAVSLTEEEERLLYLKGQLRAQQPCNVCQFYHLSFDSNSSLSVSAIAKAKMAQILRQLSM